ncbi:MAG: c-type cytochrome [Thiobacillus sp.]
MRLNHITGILFWTASSLAFAAPPAIVTQGKGGAISCASCHGMEGAGNSAAGYPALAQMPAAYFSKQIADFKSGTRNHPVMTPIAKALTQEDADAAANYYAMQPRLQSPSAPADAGLVARGEKLANNGAWDRGIPACFKCHAPGGTGVAPSFPPLAGQHVVYTLSQLEAWKKGTRTNDPLQLMKVVAEKLSDDEMRSVAAYVATLGAPNPNAQPASSAATVTPAPSGTTPNAASSIPVAPMNAGAPISPGKTATPPPQAPLTPTSATKKPTTQEKTK